MGRPHGVGPTPRLSVELVQETDLADSLDPVLADRLSGRSRLVEGDERNSARLAMARRGECRRRTSPNGERLLHGVRTQVEQDLILSRALVTLFSSDGRALGFPSAPPLLRGHRLQIRQEIDSLALDSWLGPSRESEERHVTGIRKTHMRLKIEINTRGCAGADAGAPCESLVQRRGRSDHLQDRRADLARSISQRRDLFDLWLALTQRGAPSTRKLWRPYRHPRAVRRSA